LEGSDAMTPSEWKAIYTQLGKMKTEHFKMIGQIEAMQLKLIGEVKDVK
jgi:uncharacterized protein YjeT (DUF2065 family)